MGKEREMTNATERAALPSLLKEGGKAENNGEKSRKIRERVGTWTHAVR